MTKVKLISKTDVFFEYDMRQLTSILFAGILFGVINYLIAKIIFNFNSNWIMSFQISLIISAVIIFILMTFFKIERALLVVLPTVFLLWYINLFFVIDQNLIIYYLIAGFWFIFFGWISQISNIKISSVIIIISTIVLKLFI